MGAHKIIKINLGLSPKLYKWFKERGKWFFLTVPLRIYLKIGIMGLKSNIKAARF